MTERGSVQPIADFKRLISARIGAAMAAQAINLADLLKDVPAGAWAAVWNYTVLAYGADMQQVLAEARKKGIPHPIIVKVPDRPETMIL